MSSMPTGTFAGSLAPTRAHHPGMLDLVDLTPGRLVRRRNVDREGGAVQRITGVDAEHGRVELEYTDPGYEGVPDSHPLADYGLVPYHPAGLWNQWNWIEAA